MKVASSSDSGYRPDIDGLRAVAVLLVVGFHAFPQWIRGGFIGVDVFFVISGYLITGILVDELKSENFSFGRFYARRIRRIFPALIVVLAACFALGWWLLLPDELKSLGSNIAGGAGFLSNFVLLHQSGYFDADAARKPLLHLWSLGIEEQFYLIWPLVLMIAFRAKSSSVGWTIAVVLAVSFLANVVLITADPVATFYLPFTRAWELMAGAILAWFATIGSAPPSNTLRPAFFGPDARAALGLGLIGAAVILLGKSSVFPGWWALLPTGGTVLLISADKAWISRKVLGAPAFVFIGLISYPLYLWHWPLLSFQRIADPDGAPVATRLILVAVSIVLAWLTYVVIERPVRFGKVPAVSYLSVAMVVVGAVGLGAEYSGGFPGRLPPAISALATATVDNSQWRGSQCFLDGTDKAFSPICLGSGRRPLLLLWGDSYAASLYPGLEKLRASFGFGLAQYTTAGCPPIPSFVVETRPRCVASNNTVLSVIRSAKPDIVLLYSIWSSYPGFRPDKLDATVAALRSARAKRIVLMGPPPMWAGGLPQAAYEYYREHRFDATRFPKRTRLYLAAGVSELDGALRARAAALGIEYISVWNIMCNARGCLTRTGDNTADLVTFDYGHLSGPGAEYLAAKIMPDLFPNHTSAE